MGRPASRVAALLSSLCPGRGLLLWGLLLAYCLREGLYRVSRALWNCSYSIGGGALGPSCSGRSFVGGPRRQHARWSGAADPDEPVSFTTDPHQPNHLAHLRYWRSSGLVDYPRPAPPTASVINID